ncbi:hypothetical protein BDP55DRAFT_747933 [Colletotrichum godetiae]|uniref:Uncharacterized protein n=1 Tax=Colletotrichum godetiae TaxID=1209918 RepID=A0AAJ0F3W1_9PEZI|nr:uncharacterized protein BDP55DRAFT_747933 [Colletotrichum godetiae]KAK1699825.1 hypothetical protein BDP55DRAFT_747933 [Colletotrichum godetiae]
MPETRVHTDFAASICHRVTGAAEPLIEDFRSRGTPDIELKGKSKSRSKKVLDIAWGRFPLETNPPIVAEVAYSHPSGPQDLEILKVMQPDGFAKILMDWKPFSADASLSLYFSDMVRDTSDVPHGQVRQCFDSHEHSHDDLANIHIPFSELRDMLRVAIATAIQDRDIPHDGDESEEEADMADGDIDGHTSIDEEHLPLTPYDASSRKSFNTFLINQTMNFVQAVIDTTRRYWGVLTVEDGSRGAPHEILTVLNSHLSRPHGLSLSSPNLPQPRSPPPLPSPYLPLDILLVSDDPVSSPLHTGILSADLAPGAMLARSHTGISVHKSTTLRVVIFIQPDHIPAAALPLPRDACALSASAKSPSAKSAPTHLTQK